MRSFVIKPGDLIPIGRAGENQATEIRFDVTGWAETFGAGTYALVMRRPGEDTVYPITVTTDGEYVVWVVSNVDTGIVGNAQVQLRYTVDGTLAKSVIYRGIVGESLDNIVDPPDPYEDLIGQMVDLTERAEAAAESASGSAGTATTAAEAAQTAKTSAETAAGQAQSAKEAAQGSATTATQAKTAAQTAQTAAEAAKSAAAQSATAASGSATAAAGSATEAAASATAADASADAAAASAATFETDPTLSIEGKAADALATGDNIRIMQSLGCIDITPTSYITGKGIAYGTGAVRSATAAATDFIDVSMFGKIKYSRRYTTATGEVSETTMGMAFYNARKTYISGESQVNNQSVGHYEDSIIAVPPDAVYARFSFFETDTETTGDRYINGMTAIVSVISDHSAAFEASQKYNNLWAIGSMSTAAALDPVTGAIKPNADYNATDFIPVTGLKTIIGNGARYWFYDANKARISGATGVLNNLPESIQDSGWHLLSVPVNAVFFRICARIENERRLYASTAYDDYLYSLINPTPERKIYCLGDSITKGMYAEQGASSSSGLTSQNYPYWIGKNNNMTVVNLGNSGSGWANKGTAETPDDPSTSKNAKDVVDNNTFADADIITLAYGVNDWKGAAQNIVLGSMASTSGDGTVIGNMKYCIETLATKKPTAQIIVLLPLNTNRQWTGMDTMTVEQNWAFGYAYRNNQTLEDYRDAIRECANYYNVKVVDLEEICPINRLNIRSVLGDGLHPTLAFHKQMGEALAPLVH